MDSLKVIGFTIIVCVTVVDRKKDLVKLMHGEYISLGKVERVMAQSKYIDNCCVYGDSKETYVVLFVVPNPENIAELGKEVGVNGSLEELANNKAVMDALLKDVKKVAAEGMVSSFLEIFSIEF